MKDPPDGVRIRLAGWPDGEHGYYLQRSFYKPAIPVLNGHCHYSKLLSDTQEWRILWLATG
jgi:hypothetical protein